MNPLSDRESQVLTLLRQGKLNKAIAYEIGCAEATVKVHVRNIYRKLGLPPKPGCHMRFMLLRLPEDIRRDYLYV